MSSSDKDHKVSVVSRYDEFQSEAVANLVDDFKEQQNGRFLLVIPTGGGKTYTAVKAINRLFAEGVLDPETDMVVWGAHRSELIKQARKTFSDYATQNPEADFSHRVFVGMMSKVLRYVSDNDQVRIAVIDEAHHAVEKNITYGPLFHYPRLGMLGLTATPSRHDGEPLDFEKESFSIGFPDMVERQLILSPTIDVVKGGRFEEIYESGVAGFTGLDGLDCPDRDKKIIGRLLEKKSDYKKIIIYAASKEHVRNLHHRVCNSDLVNHYESIDYILGGNDYTGNDTDRESFIERVKSYKRSIVVNCDVLTEGYDDPEVNTVVMATPTRSKLVYMQAIGRCIRVNVEDPLKRAYIVEVVDELPNIRYRINNRWLFSEISDTLEPNVEDYRFGSGQEFRECLETILEDYNAKSSEFNIPEWDKTMRYSLLLFRSYIGEGKYRHIPILIDSRNRSKISNWFNFLSERMASYHDGGINSEEAMMMARYGGIEELGEATIRQLVYESMEEAHKAMLEPITSDVERQAWITFVSLRYKSSQLPAGLESFLEDVVNREQLVETVRNRAFLQGDYLIKLPLPLASSVGLIVSGESYAAIEVLINELEALRTQLFDSDHLGEIDEYLKNILLPIPTKYLHSLSTVVREQLEYSFQLQ